MDETSNQGDAPKRFSQILKEENPSAESIKLMRWYLQTWVTNIRRKFHWGSRRTKKIPLEEQNQQDEDIIDETIAELMARYREKVMPSRVTEKAAYYVLNQVRNWVRQRYSELNREEFVSNEDLDNFAPVVFSQSTELELEDFEELHRLGVIDMVDFYFLLAPYRGLRITDALELLNRDVPKEMKMSGGTARKILSRARSNVQKFLEGPDFDGLTPSLLTLPVPEIDPRRKVDHNRLMSAFRFLLAHSV